MDIGFIGLGVMGAPMAGHLIKGGHKVRLSSRRGAPADLIAAGGVAVSDPSELARQSEIVILMVPDTPDVEKVLFGDNGVAHGLSKGKIVVDMSSISPIATKEFATKIEALGCDYVDAPVSGGEVGAKAASLSIMVGAKDAAFARAKPILEAMGKRIVHCGGPGAGQAAKICNNMILGATMIATCEAFALGEKLGLSHQALFDVAANASGQSWSLTSYCPVPGPVPASPANRGYKPGFAAALMLKDLKLSQQAAADVGATTPLGAIAAQLYGLFVAEGHAGDDFSAIIGFLRGGRPGA